MKRKSRLQELVEAHGSFSSGKIVCSDCVVDEALVEAVKMAGLADPCDYCGQTPALPGASADVGLVFELVREGILHEYEDPANIALYDSKEGGYQVPTWYTWDLVYDLEISYEEGVLRDVIDGIEEQLWCERNPYAVSPTQALLWGWEMFREFVKHRRRYTFLSRDDSTADGVSGYLPMHEVPAAVARAVEAANLVTTVPIGTVWWRARAEDDEKPHSTAAAIGPPPDIKAKDNRMTPKGIGAFYGASTAEGAVAEIGGYEQPGGVASVGAFTTTVELAVVDLRKPPPIPSLFDPDRRHLRADTEFMLGFAEDVRQTAKPDDEQNLDYVPTQVVAEYFRYELSRPDREIAGVLWKSSKDESVDVCVLFVPSDKVADLGEQTDKTILALDPASVHRLLIPSPPKTA